jgi:hypothetical protein
VYIVWDLNTVRLTQISKFYNSTNHLNHAQPTWGNQIVSKRNIWIANDQPTDKAVEAETRGNEVVQNLEAYTVSSSFRRLEGCYPQLEETSAFPRY